ncbi:MAG: hypothetical protein ACRDRQ_22850 [Pseudonocardiaceae bacterium]
MAADGLACVICGREFRRRRAFTRLPVGLSPTGSQVYACVGDCTDRAGATPEVLVIPADALTAGGIAFLAVTDRAKDVRFGASPDDLVAETVQAAAPLVVAAELRRIAAKLRNRATELDPRRT